VHRSIYASRILAYILFLVTKQNDAKKDVETGRFSE
jgi:hypothetical protein